MSSFVWIDHSERQRRQVLDAIDLFREKDTRDELGLASIRDAISDALFPGTGSLQTRAGYFLFVPWMYRKLEAEGASESDIARKSRAVEIALIDALAETEGPAQGVIGINARKDLQRTPASVYWNGLRTLGIMTRDWTQAEYYRSLGKKRAVERDDDGVPLVGAERAWHTGLPPAPQDFPSKMSFALRYDESAYLKERIIELHRNTLFAFLMLRELDGADAAVVWDLPEAQALPVHLARQVFHARMLSQVMNGAAILYNLWLARMEPKRSDISERCEALYAEWSAEMKSARSLLAEWDLNDFWLFIAACGARPSPMSRVFVERWVQYVRETPRLDALIENAAARELVAARERSIKGPLARFESSRAREMWQGEAGIGRMDFRWTSARIILRDINAGLRGPHA